MAKRRLVDAAPLEDFFENKAKSWPGTWSGPAYSTALEKVKNAPTVDAVEVVHGWWIPLEADGYADGSPVWDLWECSECREEHSGDEDTLTPYCPNCGAKMDGGNEDG